MLFVNRFLAISPSGSTVCLCREPLSAVAHGGDPQDRAASPPQLSHYQLLAISVWDILKLTFFFKAIALYLQYRLRVCL